MNEIFGKITSKDIRNILAVIIVLGTFVVIITMLYKEVPQGNRDTINLVVGTLLGGALGGVVGYYFGSSKNEADKAKKEGDA